MINFKQNHILKLAIQEAEKSNYKQKLGAVIFDKKIIISSGHNTHSSKRKKLHPQFQKWNGSIHAEVDAIIRARKELKGCSLLVVRLNNKSEIRLAKPCKECMKYILYVGIKKIYYSSNKFPFIEKINVKNIW